MAKNFSLILQQEREFKAIFILLLKSLLPILPFTRDLGNIFAMVSLAIVDGDALLGPVVTIPSIVTIVTELITPLVIVGLSMACL